MIDVSVCIPWIDRGCDWRRRARDFTHEHWLRMGVLVHHGTSDEDPVNRSAARNDAANRADTSVIVFADADTFLEPTAFWEMVRLAEQTGRLVHGFTKHMKLTKKATLGLLDGTRDARSGEVLHEQPLGVVAISRNLLQEVGGFDERFSGWGSEDRAFEFACMTLAGPGQRVKATSYHLWHPKAPEQGRVPPQRRANLKLGMRYKNAAGHTKRAGPLPPTEQGLADAEAMRALLREPGGPLHPVFRRVMNNSTQIV